MLITAQMCPSTVISFSLLTSHRSRGKKRSVAEQCSSWSLGLSLSLSCCISDLNVVSAITLHIFKIPVWFSFLLAWHDCTGFSSRGQWHIAGSSVKIKRKMQRVFSCKHRNRDMWESSYQVCLLFSNLLHQQIKQMLCTRGSEGKELSACIWAYLVERVIQNVSIFFCWLLHFLLFCSEGL